jgi:hypothetical protein
VAILNATNGLGTSYSEFRLDLDGLAAPKSVARDATFYIRFRDYNGTYANHVLYLVSVGK